MAHLSSHAYEKIYNGCPPLCHQAKELLHAIGLSKALDESADKYIPFINASAKRNPEECGGHLIESALRYCMMEMPSITDGTDGYISLAMENVDGYTDEEKFANVVSLIKRYLAEIYRSPKYAEKRQ